MAQGVQSDFSKCPNHMRGADLRGTSLGRSKFDGVDLSFAIFDHADVHGSTFYGTKLENASFLGANLAKANFFTANLRGANFTGATLTEADMTSAEMGPGTTFRAADMTRCQIKSVGHGPQGAVGVVFDGANLERAVITDSLLFNSSWENTIMVDIRMEDMGLKGALFRNATLDRAAIVDARLQGARIIATSFDNVNLNGPCDLTGIYIANSTFRAAFFPGGANFAGAHAVGSDFSKAHLVLAEFANANLSGTSFRGAEITDSIFDGANIDQADFRGVVGFEKASFHMVQGVPVTDFPIAG